MASAQSHPQHRPLVLLILDGFGHSENPEHNAIHAAKSPVWDKIWAERPHTLIQTSGMAVGLPEGQMGNSEVGHMTLGAGRVVYQNFTRINKAIEDGDFFRNPAYTGAVDKAVANNGAVHIMGLLSEGGVHSHEDHIVAMVTLAAQRGATRIYLHAFLDGRDTPPRSAEPSLQRLMQVCDSIGNARIATLAGRYFAMDRDQRWDRTQSVYDMLTRGEAEHRAEDPLAGLAAAYERGENDEFVAPTLIGEPAPIADGDALIFMNFRPDRARQLSRAFTEADFDGFKREATPKLADFVMTTEYAGDIQASCAFPPENLINSFGEYVAGRGLNQLRIAETEKYAHVTFFFSGGREEPYAGETRELIKSPNVATYDLQPEMSAPEVTEKLVAAIESGHYDAIICNYANGDMVGHTGVFEAAVKAVEALDSCVERVVGAALAAGGEVLITADHGNVEEMYDAGSGQVSTQHSTLPVPFVYIGERKLNLRDGGSLADVAPTMLVLMDLPQPAEMTGHSLVQFDQ
ncbi:2,3-bisphosphoglycerate-independent phosphoglycerate mutase [Microbulbifer flavimaris]|uniref:2,3-bisphosphoglycerate-independent phosphoglycerate mutase n=1 Tax=Microbulbifer flavimaris TaxID=1781068 RepID=A0ABX4I0R7_9GAMM|nr:MULTISPECIES: 2,3-bisphosphoglycerate-independent phosphoglycerate mutase [Microbulbifer]KUJ83787.1 2,3-bisphosphoglycerate-independent phosphoglycerate mutase [Microbulbifer sp. ZGT114]PCO05962.1 2,3-bisphosphoglycerate-independent phosphoglycerate mutase [Microbulbifer flavimaris]